YIRSDGRECAMKAFIFERNGEPTDVLGIRDLADPVPGPGEVLVRIRLSPMHPADLHMIRGRFGRQPAPPTSPGVECVGVAEALGPGVLQLALGRVQDHQYRAPPGAGPRDRRTGRRHYALHRGRRLVIATREGGGGRGPSKAIDSRTRPS